MLRPAWALRDAMFCQSFPPKRTPGGRRGFPSMPPLLALRAHHDLCMSVHILSPLAVTAPSLFPLKSHIAVTRVTLTFWASDFNALIPEPFLSDVLNVSRSCSHWSCAWWGLRNCFFLSHSGCKWKVIASWRSTSGDSRLFLLSLYRFWCLIFNVASCCPLKHDCSDWGLQRTTFKLFLSWC